VNGVPEKDRDVVEGRWRGPATGELVAGSVSGPSLPERKGVTPDATRSISCGTEPVASVLPRAKHVVTGPAMGMGGRGGHHPSDHPAHPPLHRQRGRGGAAPSHGGPTTRTSAPPSGARGISCRAALWRFCGRYGGRGAVPSLVDGKNNSRAPETRRFRVSGRSPSCDAERGRSR
jgi:hypothetical protein